ncbi:stealth family protein [Brevibacterium picturae]|uniref:Stealth family protein n=1 Tax=Brevibacterium picturae TaxID=260553 RepID=A0ABN2CK28_9MICO
MWLSPRAVRSALVRSLTPERKLWISKLRHGEHSWQQIIGRPASATQSHVSDVYDARSAQASSLADVRRLLDQAGVDFVELPGASPFSPTLVVPEDQTPLVVAAFPRKLASSRADEFWSVRLLDDKADTISVRQAKKNPGKLAAARCLRHCIAPNGRELSTPKETVTVEFWSKLGTDVTRADGAVHLPGTLRRKQSHHDLVVDYLSPSVWQHALTNGSILRLPAPHLKVLHEPIDIVYTWVDGADPAWRRRMYEARSEVDLNFTEPTALADSRFTSRDELRYSLRSLEYYASWARRVFIVTDDQVPAWLNTDHPQITVVDHRDIFTDPGVLPVFNSHAIESQLHHIPGLSDRYLYLNDDCFFLRPTEPELFFTGNGLAKHFPSVVPIDVDGWSPRDLPIISAAKQGRDFLLEQYGQTVTHRFKHTPHAQLRPVLTAMERRHPAMFAQVAASKFRAPDDFSVPSSLHHFDAYAQGKSIEGDIGYQFVDLARTDLTLQLGRIARRTDLDVCCINETHLPHSDADRVDRAVRHFLNDRFPVPSSFEHSPMDHSSKTGVVSGRRHTTAQESHC